MKIFAQMYNWFPIIIYYSNLSNGDKLLPAMMLSLNYYLIFLLNIFLQSSEHERLKDQMETLELMLV